VYLAALGPAAAHTARLTFAANLFQAGGVEPVTEGSFEDSGATEVCLCSSDALYEEQAEAEAARLRAAGASHVFLAGRPGQHCGVDAYVFAGCDAVAVLSATLDRMGVVS
ncbi:methylmalonyl-CoA mutase, partial [Streptomyces sp. NPDC006265]